MDREDGQDLPDKVEGGEPQGYAEEPLRLGEGYLAEQAVRTVGSTWQYFAVAALFLGLAFIAARRRARAARSEGSPG